ncbi:MAG: S41 family peptidase [Candidatus Giovannonibacteria bacterium]|nr:MAG: S41 family peptidase [Candidatus Giovannonibacteria bacterium]
MDIKKRFGLAFIAALILASTFAVGFYFGVKTPAASKLVGVVNTTPQIGTDREEVDFSEFWHAWNIAEGKFVDIDKVKRKEMIYGAIAGMVKSLGDPYTVFFAPEENKIFKSDIKGEFEGVGMEIAIRREVLIVVAPLKSTPAEKAGIKAGDKILKIDDRITSDLSVERAVGLIRGPKGTKVKLTILRNGEDESRIIEITRDVIKIPVVDTGTKTAGAGRGGEGERDLGDIFIIKLYNFSENSPGKFRDALREMLEKGRTKLIIDLRNNPGGYLEAAVDMASWFLPQGEVVVQEDFGGKSEKIIHRSRGYYVFKNTPIVILVNQGSASASEILAGALRDHSIAKLVGERTFGKASVQELVPLTADTSLKVTIAKWLTPKGQSISEGGLAPDIEVKVTKEDTNTGRDPVMERAVEILNNWK